MEETKPSVLTNGTYVSLALAFTIILNIAGAFYTFGIQSQKISSLEERLSKQETYALDVATMKEQIRQFSVTLSEVRTDVKTLLSTRTK